MRKWKQREVKQFVPLVTQLVSGRNSTLKHYLVLAVSKLLFTPSVHKIKHNLLYQTGIPLWMSPNVNMSYVPNHKYYFSPLSRDSLSWLMDQIPLCRNLRAHLDSFPRAPSSSGFQLPCSLSPSRFACQTPHPNSQGPFTARSSLPLPTIVLVSQLPLGLPLL